MLDDRIVDSIQISWNESPSYIFTKVEGVPVDVPVLADFLTTTHWNFVLFMAEGVNARGGRAMNECGFRYPEELESDDEPFEGVLVYDYYSKVVVGEPAFIRLMSRLFQTLVQGADQTNHTATSEDWWPRFVEVAAQIEVKAGQG